RSRRRLLGRRRRGGRGVLATRAAALVDDGDHDDDQEQGRERTGRRQPAAAPPGGPIPATTAAAAGEPCGGTLVEPRRPAGFGIRPLVAKQERQLGERRIAGVGLTSAEGPVDRRELVFDAGVQRLVATRSHRTAYSACR